MRHTPSMDSKSPTVRIATVSYDLLPVYMYSGG
uniref:Uncharacterized protein n=1 Tax=Anguilla anguilla TaxID=7936 RepID=A0A0E9VCY5_ANGAN